MSLAEEHLARLGNICRPPTSNSCAAPRFISDKDLEGIRTLPINDDDIFITGYPKSGTTWMQEMVCSILDKHNEGKPKESYRDNFFVLEFPPGGVEKALNMAPLPKLIKTHVSYKELPDDIQDGKGKVIYVARNPKDAMVSGWDFYRKMELLKLDGLELGTFFQATLCDKVPYSPWLQHVRDFWLKREKDNVLFLTYESTHQDPSGTIMKIAAFLDKPICEDEAVKLAEKCAFSSVQNKPSANYTWFRENGVTDTSRYLRKGKVGDWKNHFTEDMSRQIDSLCKEHLEPLGLTFSFQLED